MAAAATPETAALALAAALTRGADPAQVAAVLGTLNGQPTTQEQRTNIIDLARASLEGQTPRPDMALAMLQFLDPSKTPGGASLSSNSALPRQIDAGRGAGLA